MYSLSQIRCHLQMPANNNNKGALQRNFALPQILGDIYLRRTLVDTYDAASLFSKLLEERLEPPVSRFLQAWPGYKELIGNKSKSHNHTSKTAETRGSSNKSVYSS